MELEVQNLKKAYGSIKALDDLNIHMEAGIYGILGPNGAGKSTLMNILTQNLRRDSGRILYNGTEVLQMGTEYRRLVGYMPQEQICYPQYSALEFLRYMALLKGLNVKSKEVSEQIDSLLEMLNLFDVRKRRISTFSGGMKRRIVLAQALLGNPKLLILDEPTAGLDPKERIAIRNLIARMAKDRIVILATHIASDIECIADSVILMKGGKAVRNENPFVLIDEVRGHVREIECTREELEEMQQRYHVSNCVQKNQKLCMHVIEKEASIPEANVDVTLDDVYLYYFEVDEG